MASAESLANHVSVLTAELTFHANAVLTAATVQKSADLRCEATLIVEADTLYRGTHLASVLARILL
jgi:hypothetical protein